MGFLFTNPLLLAALAGLGVPVLIHLLLKRKNQRLRFSTLRFFQQHQEQASQKRKLRNVLLMALRMLILALLVLAFTRPYLPLTGAAARARNRQQAILVVDTSLSMTAGAGAAARWNRTRKVARDYLESLSGDDRVALITGAAKPSVASGFAPPSVISAIVADLLPDTAPGDVAEGLREANRLVSVADPALETTIAIVSDFQRTGAANLANVPLPPKLTVKTLPVGDLLTPNLAVTELNLESGENRVPHATVVSYSDEDNPGIEASLVVDGKVTWTRGFSLGAGASTNLDLPVPRLVPGWHGVEIRIKARSADALPVDDSRHQAVFVPEPVRVLAVEPRSVRRVFQEESFFVSTALDPFAGETNGVPARFRVQKAATSQVPAILEARGATSPEVVVLSAPPGEVPGLVPALEAFVSRGGGVLLFLGNGLSPVRFNPVFAALLPANLKSAESAPEESAWHIGEFDRTSPIFRVFNPEGAGTPALAEFTRRHQLDVLPSGTVVARFDDDVPFAISREVGRGHVLLVNASMDTSWTDWPKRKTYVPWLHRAVQHLAGRGGEEALTAGAEVVAGIPTEVLQTGTNVVREAIHILQPDGTDTALTPAKDGRLPEWVAARPGVYRIVASGGRELRRFAANVAPAESDLAAVKADDVQKRLARLPDEGGPSLSASLLGTERNQQEFWRVLLLGALLLLLVETFWSNRAYV